MVYYPRIDLPSFMWSNPRGKGKKVKKYNMKHNQNPRQTTFPNYVVPLIALDVA